MEKVVKMKDFKDVNMYKIEGKDFEKIKKLKAEHSKVLKEIKNHMEETHTALWDAVYEVIGKKTRDTMCIDTEFEELGFYVIKKSSGKHPMEMLLDGILR